MRRTAFLAGLIALVAILVTGYALMAADTSTGAGTSGYGTSGSTSSGMTSGADTGMSSGPGATATTPSCASWQGMSEQQMMNQDTAAMKQMGMSQPMQMRRKILMGMQVSADDPSAMLALRSDLNLSQDQVDKLQSIADRARNDSRDVLSDSQKKQMAQLEGTPESMIAMCHEMSRKGWTPSGAPGSAPMTSSGTMGAGTTGASSAYGTTGTTGSTGTYGTSTGTTGSMTGTTGTYGTSTATPGSMSGTVGPISGTTGAYGTGTSTTGTYGTTPGTSGSMTGTAGTHGTGTTGSMTGTTGATTGTSSTGAYGTVTTPAGTTSSSVGVPAPAK